jgi:diacylglycerol kinase family enzyme
VGAHLIVNRGARHLASPGRLLANLTKPRASVRVAETRTLDDLDTVARAIAAGDSADVVVLAGGDGSYMAGVSALARAFGERPLPRLALAPGGTVSTVARNWGGLRGDLTRYAERLLDGVAAGSLRSTPRPSLRVRVIEPAAGTTMNGDRVGFIVGSGLVARFFEAYEARGAGGYSSAARIVARLFAGSFVRSAYARSILDPMPCLLETDGVAAPFARVSLVCASVVRDVGLGMRLLYRAGEAMDRFHAVATPLGPHALGPQMPLVLAGRPLLGPRIDALVRTLTLRFPVDEDRAAAAYVLDGELFRAASIEVTAGPTLDVLAP